MTYRLLSIFFFFFSISAFSQQNSTVVTSDTTRVDSLALQDLKDNILDNIPTLSLDDNDASDNSSQNVSSLLTAGRDPFFNAATFSFFPVRFRIRGYDGDFNATYINYIPMDNIDNGFTPFGVWGGLNDVFRNRDVSLGLRANTFAFGDITSSTNIDVRASKQRKQTSIGYAYSNRTYDQRLMLSYSSGLNAKGWAYTVAGSRRYANEGYIKGTYFDGWSWFGAIDKKLGTKHLLSAIAFGAPTESGRAGPAVQEMLDLAGSNYYNPYWGYQNGKVRNANIGKTNQPVFILAHEFLITNNTKLNTSVSYSFGERSTSGIDWYNAPDPRPDYYRYLPSYYINDPVQQQRVTDLLSTNEAARQINWDNLYNVNRYNTTSVFDANGIKGNTLTGNRSYYILSERVTDAKRINAASTFNSRLNDHIDYTGGVTFQKTNNHYFQRIADMLGGSFWVDLNQFAQLTYPNDPNALQNNLDNPNGIKKEGDIYGYNYDIDVQRISAWSQFQFKFDHFDFFVSGELSQTGFYRTGNVRNGLFPENSFGKAPTQNFTNYSVKGGVTYKLNGRNYLFANAAYLTRAPYFENAYVALRTRDFIQDELTSENIQTLEAGYILNAPKLKIHLTGFYTQMNDGMNVLSFYNDKYFNFVNYAIRNIDRLYFGGEFGFEAKVLPNVTLTGAASVGRYYYNSRQYSSTTLDNTADVLASDSIYSQNYRVPGPQEAYNFGITYRSPKFWFVSLSGNYFDQMWLDFNPIRRTYDAVKDLTKGTPLYNEVLAQQRLDAQYTIDFFGGYSWKLPTTVGPKKKPVFLAIYAGLNNLLNNQNIISGGFEQLRYDVGTANPNEFPAKYYYAFGLNYFISATLRF